MVLVFLFIASPPLVVAISPYACDVYLQLRSPDRTGSPEHHEEGIEVGVLGLFSDLWACHGSSMVIAPDGSH